MNGGVKYFDYNGTMILVFFCHFFFFFFLFIYSYRKVAENWVLRIGTPKDTRSRGTRGASPRTRVREEGRGEDPS